MPQQQLLTAKEAAGLMRIHPNTLTTMVRQNKIKATKIGRRWKFTHENIDAFLRGASNEVTP